MLFLGIHVIINKLDDESTKQGKRGVAQFGRALRSGRRGRKFESCRLDLYKMACWSSGQDDALSRRKPGFDSRTGHLLLHYAAAFFKGASVAQLVEQRIRNA